MPIHIEDIDVHVQVESPAEADARRPVEPTLQRQREFTERLREQAERAARTAAWGVDD